MRDPRLPPDDADEPDFDAPRDPDAFGDGEPGDADDEPEEDGALALPEGHRVVFVSTAVPVQLSVVPLDDERAPEGTALGSYIGERLVARCAMPREAIEHLIDLDLFNEPVPLALLAVEEEPGLQCRLFALVPAERIADSEHDAEPWRASVPNFEDALADAEDDADDEDDDEFAELAGGGADEDADGDDADDDEESTVASILLGHIVRFDRDRKFAGDLTAEAVDVLQKIVLGGTLQDANAKAVDDLLDSL